VKQDFDKLFKKGQQMARKIKKGQEIRQARAEEVRQKELAEDKAKLEKELGLATQAFVGVLRNSKRIRAALFKAMYAGKIIDVKVAPQSDYGGFILIEERAGEELCALAIYIEGQRKLGILSKLTTLATRRRSKDLDERSRFFVENVKIGVLKYQQDRIWSISWMPLTYYRELPLKIVQALENMADPKRGSSEVAYRLPLYFAGVDL